MEASNGGSKEEEKALKGIENLRNLENDRAVTLLEILEEFNPGMSINEND